MPPPASPLRAASSPRLPTRTSSIRPQNLQLLSPSTNPRSPSISARLSSLSSPPPPTSPSPSPTFAVEVRSPRFAKSPLSPDLKTVTQATFAAAAAAQSRRPSISLQMHLASMLDNPVFLSPGTPTPRSGIIMGQTRTPKRVAISPVVMVASPRAVVGGGGGREVLEIVRGEDVGGEGEEKYTLDMRRGTPVTTPCVERFED